jgi:hypothetical protein
MSGLRGLVGGLAQGGIDMLDRGIKADADLELENRRNANALNMEKVRGEAALQREQSLARLKMALEEEVRQAQVGRIDAAVTGIADKQEGATRALVGQGIADPSAWTPEQQAAVDQSVAADRNALVGDPMTRFKAGVSTGDVSLKDAATVELGERRADAAESGAAAKLKSDERKDATARYIAELKDETAQKRIEALVAKAGGGKDGTREALSFIDGVRKDLASEAANLKAMYQADIKDLSSTKREAVKKEYEAKFAAIDAKRGQIEQDFSALREKVGLPAAKADAPKSEPKAEPKEPAGIAKPASQAEFDKIPKGGRYVNPKDGKTYIKN